MIGRLLVQDPSSPRKKVGAGPERPSVLGGGLVQVPTLDVQAAEPLDSIAIVIAAASGASRAYPNTIGRDWRLGGRVAERQLRRGRVHSNEILRFLVYVTRFVQ